MTRRSLYIVALAPALLAGAIALIAWPSRDDGSPQMAGEELHIHDLAVDATGGEIFIATHSGLFRIGRDNRRTSVLDASDDVTAFTVSPYGRYFMGGHPDLSRVGRFQAPGKPPLLGLIASDDRGRSWDNVSLLGDADFHALVVVGTYLYAADSTSGRLLVSGDGGRSWESRGAVELIDLAVDTRDVSRMIGVGLTERFEQRLEASRDGGQTWQELDGPPLVEIDWSALEAVGITPDGAVWRSVDGLSWTEIGRAPGPTEALAVSGDAIYVVGPTGNVFVSRDRAATWQPAPE